MKLAATRFALFVVVTLAIAGSISVQADDSRLEQSRALVKSFGQSLQAELKSGLADGGPAHAIAVCKDRAPQIASELSRTSGAKVSRTSLRYRNPANAPEPWQADVLRDFETQADSLTADVPLEYFDAGKDGSARYLRAIPTGGVCLACHGAAVSDELQERLEADYPHDLAVGYAPDDIRGAFSVTWPPTTGAPEG
jgi:hypothetical protein